MTDVLAVAAAGIISAVCAVVVRKQTPELALLLAICAGVMILLWCSGALKTVIDFMEKLGELGGIGAETAAPVIKITGIALVTRLGADFCRDAKETALATTVEAAGMMFALLAVVPLMSSVLDLLVGLM